MMRIPCSALSIVLLSVTLFASGSKPAEKPKVATRQSAVQACGEELKQIQFSEAGFPCIILENNEMKATIYTPNSKTGYYRGSRFDWSGMVGRVEFRGHTYFADWQKPHAPDNPEHGIGPAEEFDMDAPPGFAETKINESFMKIGVGKLVRSEQPANYFFNNRYVIDEPGIWTITAGRRCAEFNQSLGDTRGWAYQYAKRISIEESKLIITHTLKNTGTQPIASEQYCHNFISIDTAAIGPDYRVIFPFQPTITDDMAKGFEGLATLQKSVLQIAQILPEGRSLWASFGGLKNAAAENGFSVENMKTGAMISIKGTLPPSKFNFYAVRSAICPEPFVKIQAHPGESVTWSSELTFSVKK
jgi:hypothetical protein